MAEITWVKTAEDSKTLRSYLNARGKYLIIGIILLGAVAYLVLSGTATARYYITVNELLADPSKVDANVRVAGAVDGSTIHFDPNTQRLSFEIVNIPSDAKLIREQGGLAEVLYQALLDPDQPRLRVVIENAEVPDLLQHEAQAIVEGRMGSDGVFVGNNLLLKCPTRYSDEAPAQVVSQE